MASLARARAQGKRLGTVLKCQASQGEMVPCSSDRRIRYQQNLKARRIALVVLTGSTKLGRRSEPHRSHRRHNPLIC